MNSNGDVPPLDAVTDLLRRMSRISDPQELVTAYKMRAKHFLGFDRTVALSRRDLPRGKYRITRSDLWQREIDPWKERHLLPVLSGGLLGELIDAERAVVLDLFDVAADDPAREHLEGMKSLLAIPHFDDGAGLNMVVHLCREGGAFHNARLPDLVLMSGLFGRAMHELVLTNKLRNTQDNLREQNNAMAELTDTVLAQARDLKHHAATLEDRVRRRTLELEEAHVDAIYMIAAASEAKDTDTGDHVRRLQSATERLARAMGQSDRAAEEIGRAAILHDVGKLHVPDEILKKPGPLTDEERATMQGHTLAGELIVPPRAYFAHARRVARSHHENWDGSGYPDRLAGEKIPFEARLVHLVDVFDALTHARPYKDAWPVERAMEFVRKESGRMFEPAAVEAFIGIQREVVESLRRMPERAGELQ